MGEPYKVKNSLFSHNTTDSIDKTFCLKLKNQLYWKWNNQIIQNSITVYWTNLIFFQIPERNFLDSAKM